MYELKANCTDLWLSMAFSEIRTTVRRLTRVSWNKNVERIVTYAPITGQLPLNKPAVTKLLSNEFVNGCRC